MAAAEDPLRDLYEEATCSVCLDYFTQPVALDCGHNFCRTCVEGFWGEAAEAASCPQCRRQVRPDDLRPNRQLASVAEIAKRLLRLRGEGEAGGPGAGKGGTAACEKHREPLKLFCQEDEAPICVVCDRAREHRGHRVVPLEEAAEEYRDHICNYLETLRKQREDILSSKAEAEEKSQDLLKQTQTEKEKTVAEFGKLHKLLEVQEKLLLAQTEEMENEIAKQRDEHLARLASKLSSVESLIREAENKCQQPASELLQDVRGTMERIKERRDFGNLMMFSPELERKILELWDTASFPKCLKKQLKDAFLSRPPLQKANITLDPDTAYSRFILSSDCKSVIWGDKCQALLDKPQRFDTCAFLLGREEFTTGRHFWEVSVGDEGAWNVGVARKSVRRKGPVGFSMEEGIWAMGKWEGRYWTTKHPNIPRLTLKREPKKILVSLNYEEGRVAFYNGDTRDHLFTFSKASFAGDPLLPFFYVNGKGHLRIS